MPEAVRGKVKFEKQYLNDHESSEDEIERYSCLPPPRGSRRGGNPRLEVPVVWLRDHLQESEADRLLSAAANQGETLTFDTLWLTIKNLLDLDKLTIDLSDMPRDWGKLDCFDCVNAVVVTYKTYTITAHADERLTFGNETYPKGDVIAAWRACEPVSYRFIRRCTPNPQCCPGTAEHLTDIVQESRTFTKLSEVEFEYWKPSLDLEWGYGDYWKLHIKPGYYWRPEEDGGD